MSFRLPSGLSKMIGEPRLFYLVNSRTKFFQVDTLPWRHPGGTSTDLTFVIKAAATAAAINQYP